MSDYIKLGNGARVFACCGGISFHVGRWHKEMDEERRAMQERQRSWRGEQDARKAACIGKPVKAIEVGHGFTVTFDDGSRMVGTMTGREMDGHGEFSPESLSVEFQSAEEVAAGLTAWRAWYNRNPL